MKLLQKNLMASIQEEQDQSGISTKIDTINDGENKCLVYRPVDENTVPFLKMQTSS